MTMPERYERTASGEYSYDYSHGSQGDPEWQAFAELVAWNPLTQSEVWRQRHALPVNGGALHTAGGLVFQGTAEGYLNAYDAASGEQLGSFAAGGAIRAAPSTVVADGRQYIVVPAGAPSTSAASSGLTDYSSTKESRSRPRLLAFVLGGDAPAPAWAAQLIFPKPPVDRYPPEVAAMGEAIYSARGMRGMPRIWRPIRRGRGSRPANAPACEYRLLEGRARWCIRSAYARGGAGRCQYGGALRLSGQHRLARI